VLALAAGEGVYAVQLADQKSMLIALDVMVGMGCG